MPIDWQSNDELPITDVDTYDAYLDQWQWSSAIRHHQWTEQNDKPLYRLAFFGRMALAEPTQGRREEPPFTILRLDATVIEELTIAFSRENAARRVRQFDQKLLSEHKHPTLFDQSK